VLGISLWRGLLGLEATAVENVVYDVGGALVIHVRPMSRQRGRCGRCRRRSPGYDLGQRRRRWRTLDQGTAMAYLEADSPRVRCRIHGVTVAHVPWAAHDAGHTHTFDQQVAWLAVKTSKVATTELMRIGWRTVGAIIARVHARAAEQAQAATGRDGLDGLRRIGVDEIAYKRNYKYVTIVVDHDTGTLVWADEGRDKATMRRFFDRLGPDRAALITHVSADGADNMHEVIVERCPQAVVCADPFHVVGWANTALARVRVDAWTKARALARTEPAPLSGWARRTQSLPGRERARLLKGSRFALWKNPENLSNKQHAKLEWIAISEPELHRAYLLKEALRLVFQMPVTEATRALDQWIAWARRCRIPAFIELQRRIVRHRDRILAAIKHQMSNGLIESVNTKIRLLTRVAYGFHNANAMIAIAMLALGHHRPALPGRA
jgi:transposase